MKIRSNSYLILASVLLISLIPNTWSLLTATSIPKKENIPCSSDVMNPNKSEEDRKLVTEAQPVSDPNAMTDPNKGSELNKVDVKNSDDYDKMDLIVNDIKQVIFCILFTVANASVL